MKQRSFWTILCLMALLVGMLVVPAAAQDEEASEPALVYSAPDGYTETASLTNDNVRLENGDETILVFGPNSYAQVLGGETFETDVEELSFFLDRSGYEVGDELDAVPDGASLGVRVSLARRNQQGLAYLVEMTAGVRSVVVSLHTGRGQVGAPLADVSALLASMDFPLDIVDALVYSGDFTTLVAAVQAAGLEEALRGDGPFTVFAPNDAAFTELLNSLNVRAEALLGASYLDDVLLYHVIAGAVDSAALGEYVDANSIPTLLEINNVFIFSGSDGSLYVNNRNVQIVDTDMTATNGVIHTIDSVLLPQCALDAVAGEAGC